MDKMTDLAVQLQRLGVSQDGVVQLLFQYSEEEIERQLKYLPYRKAKRQEAFIVEAIRKNYSAPKEYFYAQTKAKLAPALNALDQGPKRSPRSSASLTERHRTTASPDPHSANLGMATGEPESDADLPEFDGEIW